MIGEEYSSSNSEELEEDYNSSGIAALANMSNFSEHMAKRMREIAIERLADHITTTASVYIKNAESMTEKELRIKKARLTLIL